jgi:diguanylate cyclase (GGDEF)-like protein
MNIDIRPLWLIGAIGANGFGFLLLFVRQAYPKSLSRVLSLCSAAYLCLGASYVIKLGRAWEGQFVFNVLSCTLVTACLSLEYWAMRELKRQPSSNIWVVGPPMLMFLAGAWTALVQRNISIELLVFNFINMALMFLIARSLWRSEDGHRPFPDVVAALVFTTIGIVTCGVILDFFRVGHFSPEYDFNNPRSIFTGVAAILIEGTVFPLFLLMVSERLNRNLTLQAMRDPLTGLYNRRSFEEIAFREIAGASRTRLGLSVVVIDIDRFKQVNDKYGHAAGDAVLNTVAATLRHNLRDEDFLCRWGGDEFCALLPRAKHELVQNVAQRILQTFQELDFSLKGKPIKVAVSIGIVTDVNSTMGLPLLIERADAALYRAKKEGRHKFAFAPDGAP